MTNTDNQYVFLGLSEKARIIINSLHDGYNIAIPSNDAPAIGDTLCFNYNEMPIVLEVMEKTYDYRENSAPEIIFWVDISKLKLS